jgi:hypothetical protein
VLDGLYRYTEGGPVFQEARAPTRDELQGLLDKIIARLMKMLTRQGYLVEEQGMTYLADIGPDNPLKALQAAPGQGGPAPRQVQTVHRTVCVRARRIASPLAHAPDRRC